MATEDIRAYLRDGEPPPADASIVLRGGPTGTEKLRTHAHRTARAYSLDGGRLLGVSVFAALDRSGAGSLEGLLAGRLVSYPAVRSTPAGELAASGFRLLASFRRPHFTVVLPDDDDETLRRLLNAFGAEEANPYYGSRRQGV